MSDQPHHKPVITRVPFNAVSSFQLINVGMLAVWIVLLFARATEFNRTRELWELTRMTPDVIYWAWALIVIEIICLLPLLRWWATRVNHGYTTKQVGFILSAFWWAFVACAFLLNDGLLSIAGLSYSVLALVCPYEAWRLTRQGV